MTINDINAVPKKYILLSCILEKKGFHLIQFALCHAYVYTVLNFMIIESNNAGFKLKT